MSRLSIKKVRWFVIILMLIGVFWAVPVFAEECGGVETSLLSCSEEGGDEIVYILKLVIEILSIGVGILAVIGISISGITYLTAKGNEQQTIKAKRRIYEIVIGLAVYAVMFAALEWLLPENSTQQALNNSGSSSSSSSSDSDSNSSSSSSSSGSGNSSSNSNSNSSSNSNSNSSSSSSSSSSSVSSKKTNAEIRAELSKVAKKFAHAKNNRDVNLKKAKNLNEYQQAVLATGVSGTKGDGGAGRCRDIGKACSAYVATVVRTVITDDTGNKFPPYTSNIPKYVKKVNKKHPGTWKTVSVKNVQPGDIVYEYNGKLGNSGHVMIFVKNSKGKTVVAHANVGTTNSATTCSGGAFWPKVTSFTSVPLYHQHAVVYRYMGGAK